MIERIALNRYFDLSYFLPLFIIFKAKYPVLHVKYKDGEPQMRHDGKFRQLFILDGTGY